ncbi:sulfotransferase domain-containing protein [Psychroflexus sp. YR1-1]|uniref:Sulfotransferase domain-containing protein n=1 Tax=Psychroflexus aurantiacus TaxID=2709310 RepID=A0A6B3R360_9FLAO|nr:sulfotransferase domain-containing protein [Psychroflexus aurantiacus]NEV93950.1 sulfotransferase domain-containing protein [Psychroflexus aurantiacus]
MKNIALFSVPRSGSSWLGEIINSSPEVAYRFQPNFAYTFKPQLKEDSKIEKINVFFYKLYLSKDEFVNGKLSISGAKRNLNFEKHKESTLFFKETHYLNVIENLLKTSDTKIIGLVRSPFAVINSWINIPKEFDPSWRVKEEWKHALLKNKEKCTHFFGYNKWKEVCFLFLRFKKQYPDQFYLINYDDLLLNTVLEIKQLFKFCDLDYSEQTDIFIKQSTSTEAEDPYAVFKQKTDDMGWKKTLPSYIEKEIKEDLDFKILNQDFKWI